jgi:hypothetical protein
MKECVFIDNKIADVLKTPSDKPSNESLFLLLSIDDESVYWIIKLQSENMSEEFLNLKFILPYGVKIIGVLRLGKINDKEFSNITMEIYSKIKKIAVEFDLEILSPKFYSIMIFKLEENSFGNSCIGLIYIPREEDEILCLDDNFNKIQYSNLEKKIKSQYFIINSFINPLIVMKKESYVMNELFSSNIGINYRDLNIMIPNASYFFQKRQDKSEKFAQEKIELIEKYQSNLENFLNSKVK